MTTAICIIGTSEQIKLNTTIILSIVFIGCEMWSLTLRKQHRQRVFENRLLGKMFGPRGDEIRREQRKLNEDDLHS